MNYNFINWVDRLTNRKRQTPFSMDLLSKEMQNDWRAFQDATIKANNLTEPEKYAAGSYYISNSPTAYAPTIPPNTPSSIEFDAKEYEYGNFRAWKKDDGVNYTSEITNCIGYIYTKIYLEIANPGYYDADAVWIDLYKNGVYYRNLDTAPLKTFVTVGEDPVIKTATLKGGKFFKHKNADDIYTIMLSHDAPTNDFDSGVSYDGYIDIEFKKFREYCI